MSGWQRPEGCICPPTAGDGTDRYNPRDCPVHGVPPVAPVTAPVHPGGERQIQQIRSILANLAKEHQFPAPGPTEDALLAIADVIADGTTPQAPTVDSVPDERPGQNQCFRALAVEALIREWLAEEQSACRYGGVEYDAECPWHMGEVDWPELAERIASRLDRATTAPTVDSVPVPRAEQAANIERFRKALMEAHAHDWTMDTISEAAHICAAVGVSGE